MIAGKGDCVIYKSATLTMYASEKETLFLLGNLSSLRTCSTVLYNCEGKILSNFFLAGERDNFFATYTTGKVIWQKP